MKLEADESVGWSKRANYSVGGRAVGGKLHVTDRRIVFRPHVLDRVTGGKGFTAPLSAVTGVSKAPKDGQLFSGGLRDRLQIELGDGSVHHFVVNQLDQTIEEELRALAHP